jgi:hypothetical protein
MITPGQQDAKPKAKPMSSFISQIAAMPGTKVHGK